MIIAVIVIACLLILVYITTYNNLVGKKNQVENAKGSLDAMLKKRYDLLPNLVAVVKNYMNYEKSTLVALTDMRTRRFAPDVSDNEKHDIDIKVEQSMRGIMTSVENYPMLKADRQFTALQGSWNECEEDIAAARRAYNAAVTDYNNGFESFPGSIFAKDMKFEPKQVIEIPPEEQANINAAELFKQ